MTHDWKPGDVGVTAGPAAERFLVGRCDEATAFAYTDGEYTTIPPRDDARPLVVIDLPNGCLAGWPVLIDALERARVQTGLNMTFSGLIAQIRSQTEPLKPEEPTGLGAVVEDAGGERYIRHPGDLAPWRWAPGTDGERPWRYYADIDAVKVLSEGVTP